MFQLNLVLIASPLPKHTSRLSAQLFCNSAYSSPVPFMAEELHVGMEDGTQQYREVLDAIHHLNLPSMMTDKGRRPNGDEPQPDPKRLRHQANQTGALIDGLDPAKITEILQLLTTLTTLVTRLDHSQNRTNKFLNPDAQGVQALLIQAAQTWKQDFDNKKTTLPLRSHLAALCIQTLLDRILAIQKAGSKGPVWQALLQKQALLADGSFPYLQWSQEKQLLEVSSRKPVPVDQMVDLLQQFVEDLQDPAVIMKFQAMRTQNPSKDIPWRMQFNLRYWSAWEKMLQLAASLAWTLVGVNAKQHNQSQSRQAQHLLETMGRRQTKGPQKGKGRGRRAGPLQP
eukprot:Skav229392  [mRNA]  locus=scaffold904:41393:42415:- [translate_table: standard]